MQIKNTTRGTILISDLPGPQGGQSFTINANQTIAIFDEHAELSVQLASFLASGAIIKVGSAEPSTGTGVSSQSAMNIGVGGSQVNVDNTPTVGYVLTATGPADASWQAPSGLNMGFVDGETPVGVVDGTNKTFTLAFTPVGSSVHLYQNGMRQKLGVDYTILLNVVTMSVAPRIGATLIADYRK